MFSLVRRAHHQIRNMNRMADKTKMAIGTRIDTKEMRVDVRSSATLAGRFPAPPVTAVMAGRIAADLTTCTLPATSKPQASASRGLILATLALAAKTMAPAAGR